MADGDVGRLRLGGSSVQWPLLPSGGWAAGAIGPAECKRSCEVPLALWEAPQSLSEGRVADRV